ncbi:hypothetical protein V1521DRAFT_442512, partial [Lipomyces starkeyi]
MDHITAAVNNPYPLYVGMVLDSIKLETHMQAILISQLRMVFVFLKVMKSLGVSGDDVGKKRLLYPAFGPACTMGYAVTRKGAQRLLLNLSYLNLRAPVDLDISWTLKDGRLRGYTVTPRSLLLGGWADRGIAIICRTQ